jgi:hypothetical protein
MTTYTPAQYVATITSQAMRIAELEDQVSALRRELANAEETETEPEPVAEPVIEPVAKVPRASPTYQAMHAPEVEAVRFRVGAFDDCEEVVNITTNAKTGVKYVHLRACGFTNKAKTTRHTVYYEKGVEYFKRKGSGSEYWDKFHASAFITQKEIDEWATKQKK